MICEELTPWGGEGKDRKKKRSKLNCNMFKETAVHRVTRYLHSETGSELIV